MFCVKDGKVIEVRLECVFEGKEILIGRYQE
jgi:hypothetical protein